MAAVINSSSLDKNLLDQLVSNSRPSEGQVYGSNTSTDETRNILRGLENANSDTLQFAPKGNKAVESEQLGLLEPSEQVGAFKDVDQAVKYGQGKVEAGREKLAAMNPDDRFNLASGVGGYLESMIEASRQRGIDKANVLNAYTGGTNQKSTADPSLMNIISAGRLASRKREEGKEDRTVRNSLYKALAQAAQDNLGR